MDFVGKVLGNRYEIIEKIGIGGMATVYKARCKLLNRNVAIKVLKDEFANDIEFIKRFQIEAQAAASLSHPNIVSIYDVGNENNVHYIVMELIEGETLKEIVTKNGRLPWKDAVDIAAQIAAGLSKAHANHIIHRDIKPHNIIITKDGVAKVTDFGIAKAVSNATINAFGSTVGSVHYFSPEHARGGYTDEKSDIYSLGIVLYEMVTGELPFNADTPVTVALKQIQETPREPIELNKDIPIGLNNIIIKAMAKDISERYQSANEMHSDLERIVKNPSDISDAVISIRKNDEFPTQRIPIVGIENTNDKKIQIEEENEENDVKKRVTKKQAVVRLILGIILAIVVVFATAKLVGYFFDKLFVEGREEIEVPLLIGLEQEEARRKLEELSLIMKIGVAVESEYPNGYIAKQSPSEGYKLKEGGEVEVNISRGSKVVLVPSVTGSDMNIEAAKIKIEQIGLVFEIQEKYDKEIPSGEIIGQEPVLNTEVAVGSTVTVFVSKGIGEGLVRVPDVVGKTEAEASKIIIDSKLKTEVTTMSNEAEEDGKVLNQIPPKDSIVDELSSVVIVVNKLEKEEDPNEDEKDDNPLTNGEKRIVPINLSNKERETFTVKVTVESTLLGSRVEYEKEHSRSDGIINVEVTDAPGAYLRVYIDGVLDSEMRL